MATHADYYDISPEDKQKTGDIWTGLPTFGLLSKKTLPGIVITPACDLAASKVETITYLPILPIPEYMYTYPLLIEIKKIVESCQNVLQLDVSITIERGKELPCISLLDGVLSKLCEHEQQEMSAKKTAKINEYKNALSILKKIIYCKLEPDQEELASCYGASYEKIVKKMIMNSYSSDIHFLPSDSQRVEYAGVSQHSLVLFRYPLTAPLTIFNMAQSTSQEGWHDLMLSIKEEVPIADLFQEVQPMKASSLRPRFLADLISRFVSLYVRIGSPDLTSVYIDRYRQEVMR